ncbi:restriction endonuclease subunit S [Spirosoma litoris]
MSEIQLPKGWVWKKLGEILTNFDGKRVPLSREVRSKRQGEYRYYGATEIVDHIDSYIFDGDYILIGEDGANLLSKTKPLSFIVSGKFWVNNHAHILQPKSLLDIKFFNYYFNSLHINDYVTGSAQPKLNQANLNKIEIPLPPLTVQQAIVARIEELFSELEAGTRELQTALDRLKIYRQAVLHHYLNNPDWERVKLGEVADMRLGKMLDAAKNKGVAQPYLRNINVRWGAFDLSDLLEMRFESSEEERYGLEQGDLVVCEGGEPGRAAIWKGQNGGLKIQKALHRIRFTHSINVEFFYHFLHLSSFNGYLAQHFTGTTIKHLTGREFAKFEFPVPDIHTQTQIVTEIEARLSEADSMETTIRQELARAENLRQSILKQAFEGKLVSVVSEESDEEEAIEVAEPASPVPSSRHAGPSGGQLSLF